MADARDLTDTEKQMIIDTIGISYRDDKKTSIIESVNLARIKIVERMPKVDEIRAAAEFVGINTEFYTAEHIQKILDGDDAVEGGGMSLPNGIIYIWQPILTHISENNLNGLLAHEVDHQYMYQIAENPKEIFEQFMAETRIDGTQYHYDEGVLFLDDIKTFEGQGRYIQDYVYAKLRGKSTVQFKVFSHLEIQND